MREISRRILHTNQKVIYEEKKFAYLNLVRGQTILIFFLMIFMLFNFLSNHHLIWLILFTFAAILFIVAFFSMKPVSLTIYEDGINYPVTLFSLIKKIKLLHCNDILQISTDHIDKNLIIKMKSGEEYIYNRIPFYCSDHLYPIIKDTFQMYNHIEFIEPSKEKIEWHKARLIEKYLFFHIPIIIIIMIITVILRYSNFRWAAGPFFLISIAWFFISFFGPILIIRFPSYILFSPVKIYFKYTSLLGRHMDSYFWEDISEIKEIKIGLFKKLEIKFTDGSNKLIPFLLEDEKQEIINRFKEIKQQLNS